MPHFDIVKTNKPRQTFRVSKIEADFDVKPEHSSERFTGDIIYPDADWNIGAIVGGSGTGKSSIAKEIYSREYINGFEYSAESVIDDMPKCSVDEISRMFYAVGFGSVPSWLKPYSVLSNGEKMRCDLARALLERDFVCFDEFTSVVDRQVAQTACLAVNKAVKRLGKKFVAVSCHYDILEWLQPDWVLDTNTMTSFFGIAHSRTRSLSSESATEKSGLSLGVITI